VTLLHLLIALSTFLALILFASALSTRARRPLEARIRGLAAARRERGGVATAPFGDRGVAPLIESLGRALASLLPGAYVRRMERTLVVAGQPVRPATFWSAAVLASGALGGGYLLLAGAATGGGAPAAAYLPGPLLGLAGALFPAVWLSSRARARKARMLSALSDTLDLLTICLEAGLSLDGAFHQVAEKQDGPLVDEIRKMLREIGLGKARHQALHDLGERTDLDDVRTLISAVAQAEQMGTGLTPVLRSQSQRLRVLRRQRAEQEARRAPTKMVFPLVFCLMPSLFIFILGPFIVAMIDFLSGQ
jgi:tight adherence protein C